MSDLFLFFIKHIRYWQSVHHLNVVSIFEMNIRVMNNAAEHSDKYPNLMYKNLKAFNTFNESINVHGFILINSQL